MDDALDEDDETVTLSLDNLEGNSVPVDISNTATLTITDDDSGLTVESVRFYTNEAAAITGDETTAITEAAISTNVYIAIQFSENVQNTVTSIASSTSPRIVGRPGINVARNVPPIIAPGAAFTNYPRAARHPTAIPAHTSASSFCIPGLSPRGPYWSGCWRR